MERSGKDRIFQRVQAERVQAGMDVVRDRLVESWDERMGNKEELNGERDESGWVGVRSWSPEVLGGSNSGEGPQ